MTSGLELHEASSMGDYDALEDYLKSGKYDVNLQDPEWKNKTPLHWAAGRGQTLQAFLKISRNKKKLGSLLFSDDSFLQINFCHSTQNV